MTWDDFKGKVPDKAKLDAETASGLSSDYDTEMKQTDRNKWEATFSRLEGSIALDRCESWVKPEAKGDAGLLKHEQGHYDISELWAREFNKALQAIKDKLIGNGNSAEAAEADLLKQLDKIQEKFMKEHDKMSKEYDSKAETDHGKNQSKQDEWNAKIADWLMNGFPDSVTIPEIKVKDGKVNLF